MRGLGGLDIGLKLPGHVVKVALCGKPRQLNLGRRSRILVGHDLVDYVVDGGQYASKQSQHGFLLLCL